jgi:hypothetical protein
VRLGRLPVIVAEWPVHRCCLVIPVATIEFHMASMIMVNGHGAIGSKPTGGANGIGQPQPPAGAPRLCDRGEEEHDQRPLVVNHRDQAAATYGQLLRKRQAGRALVSMFG